jgi:uncharacterized protein YjbI with pentapeptide repeats
MSNQTGFAITRPVAAWNKPLKANFKDLFKALSKAVVHGSTGQLNSVVADLGDAAVSVGLEEDSAQLAWRLIYNAITQAMVTLVDEQKEYFLNPPTPKELERLCENLDWSLEQHEVCIDRRFFERPRELPVIEQIKTPFTRWLTEGFDLNDAQAQAMAARLPSYFVFALNNEWRENSTCYARLKEDVETPFTTAGERAQGWLHYAAWLQKQVDEQVFGETFSLRQVYIPLRAYYEQPRDEDDTPDFERRRDAKRERLVVELEQELERWLQARDALDAVRVISGGPGCGKSSFARMFAAHQTERGELPILFIPLHQLELDDDLVAAVDKFVRYDRLITHNPLDPENGEPRLLIIFDGLDELAKQGRVGAETAQYFVREVQKQVSAFNLRDTRLQVLISGRELAVQANRPEFRKPGQILYILPYFLSEKERKRYMDPQELLAADQRDQWWRKYGKASGRGYADMPKVLRRDNLIEITAQPLLNYLVALSYTRDRLDFAQATNLNAIYEDLLKAVYERGWAGHRHAAARDLNEVHFIRVLEEIAVAAWHGEGCTTTVREVQAHCEQGGLKRLLETFEEGVSQGLSRLFLAFYFRQSGRREAGDKTFEFTHKSFREYLTARRIVRGVRRIHNELQRRREDLDSGLDEREALAFWARLCGPTRLDWYLWRLICDEARLQDPKEVAQWQQTLCGLFGWMLRYGMPIERLQLQTYQQETIWARNAEESLFALLNSCARVTEVISQIDWPDNQAFGAWIARIQGQCLSGKNVVALDCLCFLDIRNCTLFRRDFYRANFRRANFEKADLHEANLREAYLREATLDEAILVLANFHGAHLEGAHLSRADFAKSYLRRADFERANLHGAHLERANLKGANLGWTNLEEADFYEANLGGANLSGANLEKTNFGQTNLHEADFRRASLERTNFREADLRGANFDGAKLDGVIWPDGKKYGEEELAAVIERFTKM